MIFTRSGEATMASSSVLDEAALLEAALMMLRLLCAARTARLSLLVLRYQRSGERYNIVTLLHLKYTASPRKCNLSKPLRNRLTCLKPVT